MSTEHASITSFRDELTRRGGTGEVVILPDSAHTAALAAAALGCEVGAIANSLLFDAAGEPVLILTSGAHRVDTSAVAARIGVDSLERASADFVRRHTGQVIGGVSPLDHPAPIRTWIDPGLRPGLREDGPVDALALSFSSGWASGLNAYLVILVMGIADRLGSFAEIPDVLGRWDVLSVAGFLYAMEFVADKIPYIDSTWDAISTAIRPTAGAVIGVLLAGDASSLDQAVLGAVGGGTALLSHLVKAGGRLAINSSPEPVTNVAASLAEDAAVLGVVSFSLQNPEAAAAIAGVLLLLGLVMLFLLARFVRRGWRRWKKKDPVRQLA